MLYITVSTAVEPHKVASQIIRLVHCRQVLEALVQWMFGQNEEGSHSRIHDLHFGRVHSDRLLDAQATVGLEFTQGLVPELEDHIALCLHLEETFRTFGMPEKVVEDFETVVKGRNNRHFPNVIAHIQRVKQFQFLFVSFLEVGEQQSFAQTRSFCHCLDGLLVVSNNETS